MRTDLKMKETKAVADIRAAIARFVPRSRAFTAKKPSRVATVASDGGRTVILFPNGRWTVTSDAAGFLPYLRADERHIRSHHSARGRVVEVDIGNYLRALADAGVITAEQKAAFDEWRRRHSEAEHRAWRLEQLKNEAGELGVRVVERKGKRAA